MQIRLERRFLRKRFPLAISRGVSHGSENLFLFAEQDGHVGLGECAPGVAQPGAEGGAEGLVERATAELQPLIEALARDGAAGAAAGSGSANGLGVQAVYDRGCALGVSMPALAALDVALWDWLAKRAGMPLVQLLGLPASPPPTSITVGLLPPEETRQRVPLLLQRPGCRTLKIKLGSPQGLEHDQAHFEAARQAAKPWGVGLRVDANGGWNVAQAKRMLPWLAERGVEYVEQPLPRGAEAGLPELFRQRPLPIFVDESCHTAAEVLPLIGMVDGINLKLMKCGGITGALRLMATARAAGLRLMIGCMGESSVAISAAAALSGAVDFTDLDSHLNLEPDPAQGAAWVNGVVMPPARAGHGATLLETGGQQEG